MKYEENTLGTPPPVKGNPYTSVSLAYFHTSILHLFSFLFSGRIKKEKKKKVNSLFFNYQKSYLPIVYSLVQSFLNSTEVLLIFANKYL